MLVTISEIMLDFSLGVKNIKMQYLPLLIPLIIILELLSKTFWFKYYFIIGVPLYYKNLILPDNFVINKLYKIINNIDNEVNIEKYNNLMLFESTNEKYIYFREEIKLLPKFELKIKIRYTSLMHGCIKYNINKNSLKLIGFSNITTIIIILILITSDILVAILSILDKSQFEMIDLLLIVGVLSLIHFIFFIIYWIQKKRYDLIFKALNELDINRITSDNLGLNVH